MFSSGSFVVSGLRAVPDSMAGWGPSIGQLVCWSSHLSLSQVLDFWNVLVAHFFHLILPHEHFPNLPQRFQKYFF